MHPVSGRGVYSALLLLSVLTLTVTACMFTPECLAQTTSEVETRTEASVALHQKDRSWNDLSLWERLKWFSEQDGATEKEPAKAFVLKVLTSLAVQGTAAERTDFLRRELSEGVIQRFAVADDRIKETLAKLYAVSAVDAIEENDISRAKSLLNRSRIIDPGLEIQTLVEQALPQDVVKSEGVQLGALFWIILLVGAVAIAGGVLYRRNPAEFSEKLSSLRNDLSERISHRISTDEPTWNENIEIPIDDESRKDSVFEESSMSIDDIFQDPDGIADESVDFDFTPDKGRN
jgi:hypothetical protein